MKSISFCVKGSNSFHKLELAKTLLRFTEYDFTYFWEQSIETGRNARKTGRISKNISALAENAILKCHPYIESCMQTEFSDIVLDCIIAYICHSEGIGLEELWVRCISPKSLYEKAIFTRVSEYKTGRSINQWINIVRMQEYARSKLEFIYETSEGRMLTPEEYRTRREYFDLAFTVAANETGCDMYEMPSVKKYTPALTPDAAFMMGKLSKSIYRRASDVLANAEQTFSRPLNDHNRDQAALDAFSYVKDMPRPAEIDMKFALESIASMPDAVYAPDSFKAAIDMEFCCMSEEGIYLSKCPRCGKFFVRDLNALSPYCDRVNNTGKTCSAIMEEELGEAAARHDAIAAAIAAQAAAAQAAQAAAEEAPAEEETEVFGGVLINEPESDISLRRPDESTVTDIPVDVSEDIPMPAPEPYVPPRAVPEPEPVPTEIPKETEKRCQRTYNLLYKRIGRIMSEADFKEWSKYLSDMKRNVRIGEATLAQLDEFLSFWEGELEKPSPTKRGRTKKSAKTDIKDGPAPEAPAAAEPAPVTEELPAPQTAPVPDTVPESASAMFESAVNDYEEKEAAAENANISPETETPVVFKPFTPPKYNTVLEAMMDGKYRSDDLLSKNGSITDDDLEEIRVGGKRVTLPNWERISRK